MFNSPFRQDALSSRSQRQQLDRLLRVTAPHERVIVGVIAAVLLALAAWVFLGSVDRGVTIDGVLIREGDRTEAVSREPGYLVEFLVGPGDRVGVGDPIARQSVPELERELTALRDRIELLEEESAQVGGGTLRARLEDSHVALLQMEARRTTRESIVSPVAGEVTELLSVPGAYLPPDGAVARLREADDPSLQGVLHVAPPIARSIEPGMRAWIEVATPDGTPRRLDGEVAAVSPGPIPDWLVELLPTATRLAEHRVDVALEGTAGLSLPDGTPCRITIILGRYRLASLLHFGRT